MGEKIISLIKFDTPTRIFATFLPLSSVVSPMDDKIFSLKQNTQNLINVSS
jgi:hypothetical protein